jgi:hypothetical protein
MTQPTMLNVDHIQYRYGSSGSCDHPECKPTADFLVRRPDDNDDDDDPTDAMTTLYFENTSLIVQRK